MGRNVSVINYAVFSDWLLVREITLSYLLREYECVNDESEPRAEWVNGISQRPAGDLLWDIITLADAEPDSRKTLPRFTA